MNLQNFLKNKKKIASIFGIVFFVLGIWLVQAPKAEAWTAPKVDTCPFGWFSELECYNDPAGLGGKVGCVSSIECCALCNPYKTTCTITTGAATEFLTEYEYNANGPGSCTEGVAPNQLECRSADATGACPDTSNYNGGVCTVEKINPADANQIWGNAGRWDANDRTCIHCNGASEGNTADSLCGTTSAIYLSAAGACTGTGDGQFESACGADSACDERSSGNTCNVGELCESRGAGNTCALGETCSASGTCVASVCPNNVREGTEVCDGTDLAGETCITLGFTGPAIGGLACNATCTSFDTSGCFGGETNCSDGIDNDGDGPIDCQDSNCLTQPCAGGGVCIAAGTCCGNGTCDAGETNANCSADCGSLPVGPGVTTCVPGSAWPVCFLNPAKSNNIEDLTNSVINWILGIAASLIILFLIIGGVMYITAAGNEERLNTAKRIVIYAIFGLILILISYSLVGEINRIIFG